MTGPTKGRDCPAQCRTVSVGLLESEFGGLLEGRHYAKPHDYRKDQQDHVVFAQRMVEAYQRPYYDPGENI